MIDYQRVFHIGIMVPNIDAAMASMSALGLTWAAPWTFDPDSYWTPQGMKRAPGMRITYSKQGPQHIELVEGPPGSFWDHRAHHGVHHAGVWVDDIVKEANALVREGWRFQAASRSPEDGLGYFAYLKPATGDLMLELLSVEIKPLMERRWAE